MKQIINKIPNWARLIAILILAFVMAMIMEKMIFDRKHTDETIALQIYSLAEENSYISIEQKEILEPLSEAEKNSILMNRENEKILADVNGTEYTAEKDETLIEDGDHFYRKKTGTIFTIKLPELSYIRKLHLQYKELEEDGSYSISLYRDGQSVGEDINGTIDQKLDASVVSVYQSGDEIVYQYNSISIPDLNEMQLSVVNLISVNWLRVLFLTVLFTIMLSFFTFGQLFAEKPEIIFAFTALALGSCLIFCIGTNQVGFDEYVHAGRAYEISFGPTIQTTESAMRMRGNDLPEFHNAEERGLVESYEDENNDFSWANITTQSRFVSYSDRSYLPIAIMIKIGRALELPFAWNMMLGKMGNLLFYILLGFLSIRCTRGGKGIVAMLALIPNQLFAATSFTYDAVVNGFLLLAVVLTTNLLLEDKKKITWIQVLIVAGVYISGSTAKPIYIIMALMLVFLSQSRFENRMQAWGFRTAMIVIVGLMLYTIFFPPVSTSANYELIGNLAYAGDKRNQGTSVLGQLQYIFSNPLTYTRLLLGSMFGNLFYYASGKYQLFNYGYLGNLWGGFTILGEILLAAACIFRPESEPRPILGIRYKVLNMIMIFGVSAVIWTSMYVSYTAVGNTVIEGVQARYFFPLLLPLCYCLFNGRFSCRIRKENYNRLLIGSAAVLNLFAIYFLALKPINF